MRSERTHRFARLIAVVAGIAGVLLCGAGSAAAGQADHRHHPVAAGVRARRADHRHHRAAGVRRTAGPRHLDPLPGHRHPARRRAVWCCRPFRRAASTPAATACSSAPPPTSSSSRSGTPSPPSHPGPPSTSGACSTLHIWANPGEVGADFIGIPGAAGTLAAEKKPQVAGVFTDLKVAAQPGLSARIDVDTRFITTPTPLKLAAMVLGVRLRDRLDGGAGRAGPRARAAASPTRGGDSGGSASATWLADIGVVGTLLLWHIIGAHVVGRRLQPDHRPGVRRRRLHRELLPLLRRHRGAVRLVSVACSRISRRSAPPACGCACPRPLPVSAPG